MYVYIFCTIMKLTIAKFGGSAIGENGCSIPTITDRIQNMIPHSKVIAVVSAPLTRDNDTRRSITDVILEQGRNAEMGLTPDISTVRRTYDVIAKMVDTSLQDQCLSTIDTHMEKTETALNEAYEERQFADETRARALGYSGELLMSAIMHYILSSQNMSSAFVPYEEWPIITDKNLEFTNFLAEESRQQLDYTARLVREHDVVCMGGFIGKTTSGIMSTYERGGTDRTAADMGILFHRQYKTSVDWEKDSAVVSADPRIVKSGLTHISHLSYNEARIAGMFGMKILDPVAIREILDNGVDMPLRITDMTNPSRTTTIHRTLKQEDGHPIKIVTGKGNCAIMRMEAGLSPKLMNSLASEKRYGEFVLLSPFTRDGVLFTRILFTDGDFVKRNERYLLSFDPLASITYDRGIITLVGDSMWRVQHTVSRTSYRIGEAGLNIVNMDAQEETSRILIVIEDFGDNLKRAVAVVHDERLKIKFV